MDSLIRVSSVLSLRNSVITPACNAKTQDNDTWSCIEDSVISEIWAGITLVGFKKDVSSAIDVSCSCEFK